MSPWLREHPHGYENNCKRSSWKFWWSMSIVAPQLTPRNLCSSDSYTRPNHRHAYSSPEKIKLFRFLALASLGCSSMVHGPCSSAALLVAAHRQNHPHVPNVFGAPSVHPSPVYLWMCPRGQRSSCSSLGYLLQFLTRSVASEYCHSSC